MSDQYVGEVRAFPFDFAPYGWAHCDGQLVPLSTNTALFSLLGTYYGGNGTTTFGLPDLQGRIAIGQGEGPGMGLYTIGENGGASTVTLLSSEMPVHSHNLMAVEAPPANTQSPSNAALGFKAGVTNIYSTATSPQAPFAAQAIAANGGSQPHNNMMPFLAFNFCIALNGIYPPRT